MFNSNANIPVSLPIGVGNTGGVFGNNAFDSIIALAIFGLIFGNGGWGGYGSGGVQENYVLTSDFSQLSRQISDAYGMTERKLDGISNGLCDGFYTNAQLTNGVNTNILTSTNAIQSQLAQCCCDTKGLIADVNYNMATQANGITNAINTGLCQTNFNMQTNTRDIVDSQNVGTQAILAKLDAMETNRLREKLEAERDARYALQGQLDRAQLRTDIVNDVRPCPIPAYVTCNPFSTCNCGQNYSNCGIN